MYFTFTRIRFFLSFYFQISYKNVLLFEFPGGVSRAATAAFVVCEHRIK